MTGRPPAADLAVNLDCPRLTGEQRVLAAWGVLRWASRTRPHLDDLGAVVGALGVDVLGLVGLPRRWWTATDATGAGGLAHRFAVDPVRDRSGSALCGARSGAWEAVDDPPVRCRVCVRITA